MFEQATIVISFPYRIHSENLLLIAIVSKKLDLFKMHISFSHFEKWTYEKGKLKDFICM